MEKAESSAPVDSREESLPSPTEKRVPWRRIVALLLGVAIIGILLSVVGAREVGQVLSRANPLWLGLGMACFLPQFLVIGWRWQRMTRPFYPMSLGESIRLILASNTANVVLPSKLGDLGKGLVLARTGKISLKGGMSLVVFEKLLDVAALAAVMVAGTAWLGLTAWDTLSPVHRGAALTASVVGCGILSLIAALYLMPLPAERDGESVGIVAKVIRIARTARMGLGLLRRDGASGGLLLGSTVLIWVLHLIQIWMFFQAVGAHPDLGRFLCLAPLAIFIGLIPLTFGGFGHRDAALIGFFAPIPEATMLAAALLVNTRYVIPALAGTPFFHRYAARG
jgi:uncharacterized membrane protein YbhN (UPF0104 family)